MNINQANTLISHAIECLNQGGMVSIFSNGKWVVAQSRKYEKIRRALRHLRAPSHVVFRTSDCYALAKIRITKAGIVGVYDEEFKQSIQKENLVFNDSESTRELILGK